MDKQSGLLFQRKHCLEIPTDQTTKDEDVGAVIGSASSGKNMCRNGVVKESISINLT